MSMNVINVFTSVNGYFACSVWCRLDHCSDVFCAADFLTGTSSSGAEQLRDLNRQMRCQPRSWSLNLLLVEQSATTVSGYLLTNRLLDYSCPYGPDALSV